MTTLMMAQEQVSKLQEAQTGFYGMGTVLFFMVAVVLAAAAVVGVLAMMMAVAPNVTQKCTEAIRGRSFLSFLAGLPVLLVFGIFIAIGKAVPPVGIVGLLGLAILFLVGITATSEDIGRRLYWACGKEGSRMSHLISGWSVFFLSSWVPIIGWFLILPYGVISGLGSTAIAAFRRKPPVAPPAAIPISREF